MFSKVSSYWMKISDEAVYRTAPATPGLLKTNIRDYQVFSFLLNQDWSNSRLPCLYIVL